MMLHSGRKFTFVTIILEIIFIVLFAIFVDYDDASKPKIFRQNITNLSEITTSNDASEYQPTVLEHLYPMFQDVHVMVFIGFGFLFTFLKKYSYSAVGVNMFIAALMLQWAILCEGFFAMEDGVIKIGIEQILTADVAAASGLISWGALLGKINPLQTIIMGLIQMPLFACCEWLTLTIFKASDPGASIICHVFGAYFGLSASVAMYKPEHRGQKNEGAVYHSDVFAMIGTVFLWLYWPSFNAALVSGDERERAVLNTYLSLAACCMVTFAISSLVDHKSRFNMVHVQNATLAGGVAMGTACATMLGPFAALIIGSIAAIICTIGFRYLTPLLARKCRLHDTCGVNDLHGMMGLFGAIVGAVMADLATESLYGLELYTMYPAMAPKANSTDYDILHAQLHTIEPGEGRSARRQAAYQMIAVAATFGASIAGGLIAGVIMKCSIFDPPTESQLFNDNSFWEIPEEDEESPHEENALNHSTYMVNNKVKPMKSIVDEGVF
ncbi:hypothetical protein CHUAL_002199 [Chamberlinius hualienensis]